jgi:Translation initiation factor IF-2, N-terminal region
MMASGIRVYRLARELDLPSAVVLDRARRLGFRTPNQLSTLDPLQRAAVEEDLRRFPPGDPPAGVTSKLRPRGPGPRTASQAKPEAAQDDEGT